MPRWCSWCGHECYEGYHGADGRFVVESVVVTDAEIMLAHYRSARGQGHGSYARTKRNIAFGKHIGVYRKDGWAEEDAADAVRLRGRPETFLTVGAFA